MGATRPILLLSLALCVFNAHATVDLSSLGIPMGAQGQGYPMGAQGMNPQGQDQSKLSQGFDTLQNAKQQAINGVLQTKQGLAQVGLGAVQAVGQGIGQGAMNLGRGVVNVVGDVNQHVIGSVADTLQTVGTTARAVGNVVGTVNGVVSQGIKNFPGDVRETLSEARDGIAQTFDTVRDTAGALGQFVGPVIPPVTQLFNPDVWRNNYKVYGRPFETAYTSLSGTLESIAAGISAKYCSEATFTPSTKKPAKFVGSSFTLTFLSGACQLDEEAFFFNKTKQITCIKPSVTYTKTPATFTSKFKSAPKFVGKECIVSKQFGNEVQKVLYVFDGSDSTTIGNLTNRITAEMKDVLGGVQAGSAAITNQLQAFMSGLPKLPGLDGKHPFAQHPFAQHMGKIDLIPDLPGLGNLFGGNRGGQQQGAGGVTVPPVMPGQGAGAGAGAMSYQNLQNIANSYPSMVAGGGVILGSILATRHNTPLLKTTATSTASVLLLMGTFSATQEAVRRLRCQDSPINSAVAGAATGALLFAAHGAAPPRGAVICAALGAAAHWTIDQLDLERNFRAFLVAWGLLDEQALPKHRSAGVDVSVVERSPAGTAPERKESEEPSSSSGLWQRLRPYLPVRKMTDDEWQEHLRKDALKEEIARQAVLQGKHPSELVREMKNKNNVD